MPSFILDIAEEDTGDFQMIWTGYGSDESWTPKPYRVDGGLLQQAANTLRTHLRAVALLPERCDAAQFSPSLQNLARSGRDLFRQLMPPSGEDDDVESRLAQALASPGRNRPDLKVRLATDKLFVPWGFVFSGSDEHVPSKPVGAIEDMRGFWLAQFCISIAYGGSSSLPRERKPRSTRLFALHQDMFAGARLVLTPDCRERLEELLSDQPQAAMDWDEFFAAYQEVQDDQDTVLYVFGHSDGQRIQLSDDQNRPECELPAAGMWRFRKKTRGTASIFILNGCRTAAPTPNSATEPISANFLKETRRAGYYGFIGTEAQVSNLFACRYGTEFLWRLFKKRQSVGETFDELLLQADLFPQNILYACYADRNFCLGSASRPETHP